MAADGLGLSLRHRVVWSTTVLVATVATYVVLSSTAAAAEEHCRVLVHFGVLLPADRPVEDPCPILGSAMAEQSLVERRLADDFGWAVDGPETASAPVRLKFHYHDSQCSEVVGPLAAINLYYKYAKRDVVPIADAADRAGSCSAVVLALYGPCCKYALSPVGRFAKAWNVPVVTAGGTARPFSNRSVFSTLTRLAPPYHKLAEFIVRLLIQYDWRHVSLLYHENIGERSKGLGSSECYRVVEAVASIVDDVEHPSTVAKMGLGAHGGAENQSNAGERPPMTYFAVTHKDLFDERHFDQFDWAAIFQEITLNSRIVVLCASPHSVRQIMIKAAELGLDNGEYVFINVDLFASELTSRRPWYDPNDTQSRNEMALRAYESVMTITTLHKPTISPKYAARNRTGEQDDGDIDALEDVKIEETLSVQPAASLMAGTFHDAVVLYALALNETLAAGHDPTNGLEITQRMKNRTFQGISGPVSIDEMGDRNGDYSLLDLNPDTVEFEVVANYYGNQRLIVPVDDKNIHWGAGRTSPPMDIPKCGFDGTLCLLDDRGSFHEYCVAVIIIGSFLLLNAIVIVTFLVFRKFRYCKTQASLQDSGNGQLHWNNHVMFGRRHDAKLVHETSASTSPSSQTINCA